MSATARPFVRVGAVVAAVATMFATVLWSATTAGAGQQGVPTNGFVLLGGDGGIFPFNVPMAGAAGGDPTLCPANLVDRAEPDGTCWSVALTPSGWGYWILNGDTGRIYPYGTAGSYGQPATRFAGVGREFVPNFLQIVGTPSGKGYWVYESGQSDLGTVDHFGDAGFFGDTTTYVQQHGGGGFNGTPVGMAATADGKGYWEVRSDGGVFAFGSAKFYGSTGHIHLTKPIIGITATASGKGYWLYAADGGIFSFGDAVFGGSTGGLALNAPIVGMARNPSGPGYWLAAADGGVFTFGGAPWLGSLPNIGVTSNRPIFAIASKSGAVG
jgi:hypothetical protein